MNISYIEETATKQLELSKKDKKNAKKIIHPIDIMEPINIFEWNHISCDLDQKEIEILKNLYRYYHKRYKCYEWQFLKLERIHLYLKMTSIGLTVSGTIVGSVTLNPIVLASIEGPGILIQGYLMKSDIANKIDKCHFAYTSYQKILTNLRGFLRGMSYDKKELLHDIKTIDDIVIDSCPSIDHFYKKYNKKFSQ